MSEPSGAAVLDETRAFVERFVTLPGEAELDIVTCWIAHTHARNTRGYLAFSTTPRLAIISDKPGSGKSSVLEHVVRLSYHGASMLDLTPAMFAQMISQDCATVACDETDVLFGKGAAKGTLRSLMNAGYRDGAKWGRVNKPTVSVFAPLALAGLAQTFRTAKELEPLRTRCLIVEMEPATAPDRYYARDHDALANRLRDQLTTWAARNLALITESYPDAIPEGIEHRMLECAEPIVQIADAAGGRWPGAIRAALAELLLGDSSQPEPMSLTDSLLVSLKAVFADQEKMSTVELIDGLYELPGSEWRKLWPNREAAPRELSFMLAPKGIGPVRVRFGDLTVRGYRAADLAPLWDEFDALEQVSVAGVAGVADDS